MKEVINCIFGILFADVKGSCASTTQKYYLLTQKTFVDIRKEKHMKKLLLSFLLVFSWMMIKAQVLTNNGTITIVGTGSLIVEGGMTNGAGSNLTIQSGGSMSVSGDLTINAGSTVAQDGLITFNGSGNSNVTSNGVDLGNVTINKTSGDVVLVDDMSMDGALTLTSGDLVLGANDLLMATTATSSIGTASSHVNASSTGRMTKSFSSAPVSAFTFPVGDGTFYTPLASTPTGTSGSVAIAVENAAPANVVGTNFLTRNWKVNTQGFTGNALLGTYNEANDVTGSEALIKGAVYNGSAWTFNSSTGNAGANQVGATAPQGDFVFSGLNTIGTVKLKAFLAGAYNSSTNLMSIALRTGNLIPLPSPYAQDPVSASSIPSNITDWVLLEITNPSSGSDPVIYKSAFLRNDGVVVDLNGTSDPQIIGAYNPSLVRIRHRNHLSVRTNTGIDTQTPSLQDFTSNVNVFNAGHANLPMRQIASGVWGLWAGELSGDARVRYITTGIGPSAIPSDALRILSALGNNPSGQLNDYNLHDVNLDGKTRYITTGIGPSAILSDALFILGNTLNNVPSGQINGH